MKNPFGVVAAVPADREDLVAFVMPVLRDESFQPISERKVRHYVDRCVNREGALAGIVRDQAGIIGSVGITIDESDYSDEPHMMMRWHVLAPRALRSALGSNLLRFAQWFHEQAQDMPLFMLTTLASDVRPKVLLLHRKAPVVGTLHAFGMQAGKFLSLRQVDGRGNRALQSRPETPIVRPAEPAPAAA